MDKVKTPTFVPSLNRAIGKVVEANIDQTYRMGARLQRGLRRLNELFYRTLAQMIINVDDAPDLGPISVPQWRRLSEDYAQKKGHDSFYLYSGDLEAWLLRTSAADILGKATVTVSTADGKVGSVDGFQRTIVRRSSRGKVWIQTLTFSNSKTTGVRGFIKSSELQRYLQPSLNIEIFPNVSPVFGRSQDVAQLLSGGDSKVGYKLTNVAGQENRPIASHFLEWWIEVRAKRLIDRFGKVKP